MKVDIINGHCVDVIRRELDDTELRLVATVVAALGVRVSPAVDLDHVVHLYALAPTSTAQEVRALRAFEAATDAPVHWHAAEASC